MLPSARQSYRKLIGSGFREKPIESGLRGVRAVCHAQARGLRSRRFGAIETKEVGGWGVKFLYEMAENGRL